MTRAMEAMFLPQLAHRPLSNLKATHPGVARRTAPAPAGFEKHDPGAGRTEAVDRLSSQISCSFAHQYALIGSMHRLSADKSLRRIAQVSSYSDTKPARRALLGDAGCCPENRNG
jgi:uncharacterized ParB-like nuclease family protein